jgi:type IV pilus assembly protein PilV
MKMETYMKTNQFSKTGRAPCQANLKQRGATLIEILVTVLILSFGMLGMAALQTRALQGSQSSVQRSQAIMLNNYIMDAMRVDRESAKGGDYNTGANPICGPSGVTGSTLSKNNMRDWLTAAQVGLGVITDTTTCGFINCDSTYACTVRIQWDDSKAGGEPEQKVEIRSIL